MMFYLKHAHKVGGIQSFENIFEVIHKKIDILQYFVDLYHYICRFFVQNENVLEV